MYNPPLFLISSKCTGSFFNKIHVPKTCCVAISNYNWQLYYNIDKNVTSIEELLKQKIVTTVFENDLFELIINTEDINTKKYLIDICVPNYVHPTVNELLDILNFTIDYPNYDLNPINKQHIKDIQFHVSSYYYTSLYENLDDEEVNFGNFNLFCFDRLETLNNHFQYFEVEKTTAHNHPISRYFRIILVHNSLISLTQSFN